MLIPRAGGEFAGHVCAIYVPIHFDLLVRSPAATLYLKFRPR